MCQAPPTSLSIYCASKSSGREFSTTSDLDADSSQGPRSSIDMKERCLLESGHILDQSRPRRAACLVIDLALKWSPGIISAILSSGVALMCDTLSAQDAFDVVKTVSISESAGKEE
jgi:hypothetical protein